MSTFYLIRAIQTRSPLPQYYAGPKLRANKQATFTLITQRYQAQVYSAELPLDMDYMHATINQLRKDLPHIEFIAEVF